LRKRLTRRGVTVGAGALGVTLAIEQAEAVPQALLNRTLQTILLAAGGTAPAAVSTLAEGVLKTMFVAKLKLVCLFLLPLGLLGLGVGALSRRGLEASPPPLAAAAPAGADDERNDQDAKAKPEKPKDKKREDANKRFRAEEVLTKSFKTRGKPRLVVDTF